MDFVDMYQSRGLGLYFFPVSYSGETVRNHPLFTVNPDGWPVLCSQELLKALMGLLAPLLS